MDRIVVAFANEESQRRIARLLESDGVSPAGCFFSGADAIRAIRQLGGGIVVCGFKLRDMTAQDLAASLQDLATLLVVSSAANLDFCEGKTSSSWRPPPPGRTFSPRWTCCAVWNRGAIPARTGRRRSSGSSARPKHF